MSFNKKTSGKAVRDKIDDTLGDLLGDDTLMDDLGNSRNLPNVFVPEQHDYVKLKGTAAERAKKTISSLMKFYLTEDIINNDEYIQAKKRIDEMTLSSLIFQLEAGERALVTLMRTIDGGELSPRMFEVLATLQKSMLDIIKSQTMYLMAAEESAKKLSRDVEVYKGLKRNVAATAINNGGNVNLGTKSLMQSIQEEIRAEAPIVTASTEVIKLDEMADVSVAEIIEKLNQDGELSEIDIDEADELNNIDNDEN